MKRNEMQVHKWNMADTITSVRMTASLHTWLNKLTGGAVVLLPNVLALSTGVTYSWFVCVLAFAASLEELAIHFCQKDYCADRKSIFQKCRDLGEMQ